jgi:polysaccharide biosynthesis protein PslH
MPNARVPAPRLRILVLSPFAPRMDGTHGGSRAIAQGLLQLAQRHSVALLYFRATDEPPLDDRLRTHLDTCREVHRPAGMDGFTRWVRRVRLAAGLLRGRPSWVSRWSSSAFARLTERMAHEWRPDLVRVEYHIMAQYVSHVPRSIPRMLISYEPGTAAAGEAPVRGPLRAFVRALEIRAWSRFEAEALRGMDAVVALTVRDRRALDSLGAGTPISVIPLGTEVPAQPLDPAGTKPPRVLFFGNFVHPPNRDAATHLTSEIMPLVWAARGDVALDLVGEAPPPALRALQGSRVDVTGSVADMTPFLDRAAVVALPLRSGGGMRVKVLESLAAGKAVVASSLALEGIDARPKEHVLVADTPGEFADAILQLIQSPERRVALARGARRWAEQQLGWEMRADAYDEIHSALMRQHGRAPAPDAAELKQ